MKKTYATLAAAAIGVIGLASAANAATMALQLVYEGSNTTDANDPLTQVNLSDPANETPVWRHYFDVIGTNFTSDPTTNQSFRFVIFDVSSNNANMQTTNTFIGDPTKYNGNGATFKIGATTFNTFTGNSDGGTPNDDTAIFAQDTSSKGSFGAAVGRPTTKLVTDVLGNSELNNFGLVAFSFTGPLTQDAILKVQASPGVNDFSWFNANDLNDSNFTTIDGGVSPGNGAVTVGTFTVSAPVLSPEPASVGLLALSGLGLLARRRRTV